MKKFTVFAALSALCVCASAQTEVRSERLDSVVVSTSRAGAHTPVAHSSVSSGELRSSDASFSLPMALNLLPSVVTYNEGGTGLGNSAMTIRGSKGSQINVTLNGITLNDAESQEVFWVNIPALTGILSHVQVQRGLGTSAGGAGAFGASINMNTAMAGPSPSFRWDVSAGSYRTLLTTASASTGVLPGGFYAHLIWSSGGTDGYIRNAGVASSSLFAVLGWMRGNRSLRLTYLMGNQRSGITWDGIDLETYQTDRRHNDAGYMYTDEAGVDHYYDNQTDNYQQHHLQFNYTRAFTPHLSWSNTLNYTRGDGYDEYYKTGKKLSAYGYPDPVKSDVIYRKKMANNYYVFKSDLKYATARAELSAGVHLSRYVGNHFGDFLWSQALGDAFTGSWYRNRTFKNEATLSLRGEYLLTSWLSAYADLQGRRITLDMAGADDDGMPVSFAAPWTFFNPRAGVTAFRGPHKVFFSVAMGHREPGRSDIKENIKGEVNPIRPERMLDAEAGYTFLSGRWQASVNLYWMDYRDMLLETGKLSSSGYAIKENVPHGLRRGIELAGAMTPWPWLRLDGNLTLSENLIGDYTSYVEVYDGEPGETVAVSYGRSPMLMSPSCTGMARLSLMPFRGSVLSLDGKYVGKQYLDNTGRDAFSVPAYWTSDLSLSQTFTFRGGYRLSLAGYVHNLFNRLYYAAGWRWEGYMRSEDAFYSGVGVYPQAPRHFSMKVSLSF